MSDISGKTRAFIWVSLSMMATTWTVAKSGASPEVQISAMRWVGLAGLFVLGGQSFVDSVANIVITLAALKDKAVSTFKDKTPPV